MDTGTGTCRAALVSSVTILYRYVDKHEGWIRVAGAPVTEADVRLMDAWDKGGRRDRGTGTARC